MPLGGLHWGSRMGGDILDISGERRSGHHGGVMRCQGEKTQSIVLRLKTNLIHFYEGVHSLYIDDWGGVNREGWQQWGGDHTVTRGEE